MKSVNRRDFLKLTGTGLIGMTMGGAALRANAQERVDPASQQAAALKYVEVSPIEGQYCDNCMYISGEAGADWMPCAIFPGKVVAAKGWCSAWMKKG